MKILCLIDSLGSGGAQRQMATLGKLLKENGHDVSFVVYANEGFFQPEVEKMEIPIHTVFSKNYFRRIWRVRKHIRRGNYDAVISFLDVPNFLNNFSAIGGKKWKVITSERSAKEEFFNTIRGKIFGWFQRYADYIVCNSHNAENMWKKYYPQYVNKLTTIYNTVALPTITSNYLPRRNGKTNIVIAASYQYLKNPIGVIKALSMMNEDERSRVHIDWYGRIEVTYGDTKAFEESMQMIKENQLENTIRLNDATKNIIDKMKEADAIALFSSVEGLPNTICEAMRLGKPILMSRVSDYNVLVDETNGYLCDWDKPETIKDAIISVCNMDDDLIFQQGKHSKNKAEGLFTASVIIKKWVELIAK